MRPESDIQLSQLLDTEDPQQVLKEVRAIVSAMHPDFDFKRVSRLYADVLLLFEGGYPGYRSCSTEYHDLVHTTDALLATVRLLHGASLNGESLGRGTIEQGMISALLHDTGYIQEEIDTEGTGAKYTLTHIDRSIAFMERYCKKNGFTAEEFLNCSDILRCTGFQTKIEDIHFRSREIALTGRILGAADLLGQMSGRNYLEKIPFLYREFREGGIRTYDSEFDLLEKTVDFHQLSEERLEKELGGVHRYMLAHMQVRWSLEVDLYEVAIRRNMEYLRHMIQRGRTDGYRQWLRRGRCMKRLDTVTRRGIIQPRKC